MSTPPGPVTGGNWPRAAWFAWGSSSGIAATGATGWVLSRCSPSPSRRVSTTAFLPFAGSWRTRVRSKSRRCAPQASPGWQPLHFLGGEGRGPRHRGQPSDESARDQERNARRHRIVCEVTLMMTFDTGAAAKVFNV